MSSLDMGRRKSEARPRVGSGGQLESKCRPSADAVALGEHASTMTLRRLRDDEEAEAGTFHPLGQGPRSPIEAPENPFRLIRRNADPVIAHPKDGKILVSQADVDLDTHLLARVFHGVVQQVEDGASK